MKVLHVLNTGHRNFGGKERATLDLIGGLRSSGIDAELVSLRGGLTDTLAREMKIPVYVPDVGLPENLNLIFAVRRIIADGGFDLVHTHDFRENVVGRLASMLAGVPVVTTVHGLARFCLDLSWLKRTAYHALDVLTAPMSSRFIALSEADRGVLGKRVSPARVRVIPIALAPAGGFRTRDIDADRPLVFGGAGRLDRQKGFDIFIRAAAELLNGGADARFAVAGSGPREDELERLARNLGVADRFELLGFVEDMDGFYAGIDVLVLSSLTERRPAVILEATARGVFVIASNVGSVAEMIKDGTTGLLVPAGDHEALADAMQRVISDPTIIERAHLEQSAGGRAFDEMIQRTIEVYREVVEGR